MTGWLEGKRALIVGGGSGIGRAVVDAFLSEGAVVGVLELDEAKCNALAAELPEVEVVCGDATEPARNGAAVKAVVERFGGLDVLVSTVGVFDFYRKLAELDVDEIDSAAAEIFATNVTSILHAAKAAEAELRANHGSIVVTASTSAYYPGRGGPLYIASKFAVRGLVTALGHEYAPDIRVNGVAPGGTLNTDLRGLDTLGLTTSRLDGPDRAAELAARNPLQVALGGPDHAWSYVFLASDRSRGITGRVINSDGGIGIKG